METDKTIEKIFYNDPDIVEEEIRMVWRDKIHDIYYQTEHSARCNAATHTHCPLCGNEIKIYRTMCEVCARKNERERYSQLEHKDWDGETPLCIYQNDQFFFSQCEFEDYCKDKEIDPNEVLLVLCEKYKYPSLNEEYFDEFDDEHELMEELKSMIKDFNNKLEKLDTRWWIDSRFRTTIKELD